METNAFTAGVIPGGLKNTYEIRLLICYLLKTISRPMCKDDLVEAATSAELVNYFEFIEAFDDLIKLGQLKEVPSSDEKMLYTVSETGIEAAATLERTLPATVRERSVKAAIRLLERRRRETENKVTSEKVSDGYQVTCRILDSGSDLLSLTLFVADEIQAATIKKQFLNDPAITYKGILALLTGDIKALKELAPSPNNDLF